MVFQETVKPCAGANESQTRTVSQTDSRAQKATRPAHVRHFSATLANTAQAPSARTDPTEQALSRTEAESELFDATAVVSPGPSCSLMHVCSTGLRCYAKFHRNRRVTRRKGRCVEPESANGEQGSFINV